MRHTRSDIPVVFTSCDKQKTKVIFARESRAVLPLPSVANQSFRVHRFLLRSFFFLATAQVGGALGDTDDAAAMAAAAAATAAAVDVGGAELGGGNVCRACGGPRFGRKVCARCGANANSWKDGMEADGVA